MRRALFLPWIGVLATGVACGTQHSGFDGNDAGSNGPGGDPPGTFMESGTQEKPPPTVIGHISGKVLAPEGTIPISGALVYLLPAIPEPLKKGVYCDACVLITPDTPYTYSGTDGTFKLPVYKTGSQALVVQKGQFRRARMTDVTSGDQQAALGSTTLPAKSNPAQGDEIPKMADLALTNAMDSSKTLFQPVWIPGQIIIDHEMRPLKIDAIASGIGCEKYKNVRVARE